MSVDLGVQVLVLGGSVKTSIWEHGLHEKLRVSAWRSPITLEPAWQRDDALHVLDYLLERGLPVLGVEVWLPSSGGPRIPTNPFCGIDNSSAYSSNSDEFSKKSIDLARRFVEEFRWDITDIRNRDEVPYFNFTVDSD